MKQKQVSSQEANEMYNKLMCIDSFLNGLEIACDRNLKENVYDIKKNSFEIRGFLLKFM